AGESARHPNRAAARERRDAAHGLEPDAVLGNADRVPARAAGARSAHGRGAARSRQERRGARSAARGRGDLAQLSTLAPASLTTFAHLAISLWISLAKTSGDSPPAVAPWPSQTFFSSSDCIALIVSRYMASSAAFGVPRIPHRAY